MPRGGYRQPENPAPVSGPGSLSRRTDGGPADSQPVRRLPNAGYGESKSFEEQQAGAPVAESAPVDTSRIVPLSTPSRHPDQPISAGAVTPGAPSAPGEEDLMRASAWLPVLKMMASRPEATQASRQFVRQLEARLHGGV